MAAKVGVTETTIEPSCFPHPTNSKIQFWDLPGIGTPNYPDLEIYCEKVKLEKYDMFLIFTAGRFTKNDLELAKEIRSVNKTFFFIRTKIDENVRAEKRKRAFDEEDMLSKIRKDCSKNLVGLVEDMTDIFLISNHHPTKWDFVRLTKAILHFLPLHQRESFNLCLGFLTSLSFDILQRKTELLKSRMWIVASASSTIVSLGASASAAKVLFPDLSIDVDLASITCEIAFYRSHLGLPEEGSAEFLRLDTDNQKRVRKFRHLNAGDVAGHMAAYSIDEAIAAAVRFIPIVGLEIAGTTSFSYTYLFLQHSLKELEECALAILYDITRLVNDFHID